jgi:hypothetical protein
MEPNLATLPDNNVYIRRFDNIRNHLKIPNKWRTYNPSVAIWLLLIKPLTFHDVLDLTSWKILIRLCL